MSQKAQFSLVVSYAMDIILACDVMHTQMTQLLVTISWLCWMKPDMVVFCDARFFTLGYQLDLRSVKNSLRHQSKADSSCWALLGNL